MTELFESTMDNVRELEVRGYSDPVNMERTMEILAKRGDEEYLYKFTGPGIEKFETAADGRCWKENKKLKEAYEKLRAEKEDLKKENEDFGNQILEYIEMNNRLQREKEEREVSAVAAKENNKLLEIENEKLKKELHSLKQERSNFTKIPMVDDCLKLSKEIEKLTFEKEMMKKGNDRLKKEKEKLNNRLGNLVQENQKLQEENDELLEGDHSLLKKLRQTNQMLNERVFWLTKENDGLREVNREYKNQKLKVVSEADEQKPITRERVLEQAKECVCGHREQDYGTPESNFKIISDLWNDYLGLAENGDGVPIFSIKNITPTDVAMMMALLKIARIRNGGGSGDSFVDLAGYAACGGEIWDGERHKDK